jgi:Flp pilus assembly protein CpaB
VSTKENSVVELEYSDKNSKRSKLYIAVGLVMALMVAGIVFVALQASGLTRDKDVTMREVVVAARDIASRKPIEEGDLVMKTVVADSTNESAFTRIDQALGRVSGVTILTGQMVTQNMLASNTEGQAYSILEPGQKFDPSGPDLRAVSISVPDDKAVAGTLVPGQLVDLIVTMAINPEVGQSAQQAGKTQNQFIPGPSTKVTLQSLTILARNGGLYILRTDLRTAEKITELTAAGGQFTLVLRPDVDDRTASTDGSTIDRLIDEYGFPVPVPPDFRGGQRATR